MIRELLRRSLSSLGWKTDRKLLMIASDDWGSLRNRSSASREALMKAGFPVDSNRFDRFDALESDEDMERLMNVLSRHCDHVGRPAVITAVCNVANPDFGRIRENGFERYEYEPATETFRRYPGRSRVMDYYRHGMDERMFEPEFHGREHLQVRRWMRALRGRGPRIMDAFANEYFMLGGESTGGSGLGCAYDLDQLDETKEQGTILVDGLRLFEAQFGRKALYFTAPSQVFHPSLESVLRENGIRLMDAPRWRKVPAGGGRYRHKIHTMGQKAGGEARYLTRNAVFEPNLSDADDGVDRALAGIAQAFRNRQPAVVSNHRAAFVGGIDVRNAEKGVRALDRLLTEVITRWPAVEFVTAAELHRLMQEPS